MENKDDKRKKTKTGGKSPTSNNKQSSKAKVTSITRASNNISNKKDTTSAAKKTNTSKPKQSRPNVSRTKSTNTSAKDKSTSKSTSKKYEDESLYGKSRSSSDIIIENAKKSLKDRQATRRRNKNDFDMSYTEMLRRVSNGRTDEEASRVELTSKNKANKSVKKTPAKKTKQQLRRERIRRQKREKCINAIITNTVLLAVVIVIILGGIKLKDYITRETISTQVAQLGSLDMSKHYEGIIYRNEKIVSSNETGQIKYVVSDGEKVSKGATVYMLIDKENLEAASAELEKQDEALYSETSGNSDMSSEYQVNKYNLDEDLKTQMQEYYKNSFSENSSSAVYSLRSYLESSITNRTNIYVEEQKEINQQLVNDRDKAEEEVNKYQKGRSATCSGIISFNADGYETEDALGTIEGLSKDNYRAMLKNDNAIRLGNLDIKEGQPLYKMVLNNDWYIVSYITKEESKNYNVGQVYALNFDDYSSKQINFKVEKMDQFENDVRIVFSTSDQIGSFLDVRKINFSIGEKEVSGLKIKSDAIVERNLISIPSEYVTTENNKCYVNRKIAGKFDKIEIEYDVIDNGNYLVTQDLTNAESVQVNDILVNKDNGNEVQLKNVITQEGVYVINNKIARFKPVEIISRNGEYIIIKYDSTSKIKEKDKIISNPKNIKMDQLLDEAKISTE